MRKLITISVSVIIIVLITIVLFRELTPRHEYSIEDGFVGVVIRGDNTISEEVLRTGIHSVLMKDTVLIYSVKSLKVAEEFETAYLNNEIRSIKVYFEYDVLPDSVPGLHERFGQEYQQRSVIPEVRASVREYTKYFSADSVDFDIMSNIIKRRINNLEYLSRYLKLKNLSVQE